MPAERGPGVRVVPLVRYVVGARSRLALWNADGGAGVRAADRGRQRREPVAGPQPRFGASPARIVRQHLTESTTFALGAGVAGTLLAVVGLDLVRALGSVEVVRLDWVRLDARALGWSLALSLLLGIAVGLAPALLLVPPASGLRATRAGASRAAARLHGPSAGASWWPRWPWPSCCCRERRPRASSPGQVLAMQVGAPAFMAAAQRADFYRRALGRGIASGGPRQRRAGAPPLARLTVVGFVDDMRRQGLEREAIPQVFEPVAQNPSGVGFLLVRAARDNPDWTAAPPPLRRLDPPVPGCARSTRPAPSQTSIVAGFAAVALVMAVIGIYGLVQYAVSTRTKEIAIRMAVGAGTGDVFRMVVGEGLALSGAGVTLGLLGGAWVWGGPPATCCSR